MLAGTVAYVNAGTQLSQIDSIKGILSPSLIASFAFIGLLPIFAKKIVEILQSKRFINTLKSRKNSTTTCL